MREAQTMLPKQPFAGPLLSFQREASSELRRLSDHAHEAIVAEVFPAFELTIDEYRTHWQDFFTFYYRRDALNEALDAGVRQVRGLRGAGRVRRRGRRRRAPAP